MGKRGVIALGIAEGLEGRHLDVIGPHGVIGPVAAMADIGAGRGKELFHKINALHGVKLRLGHGIEVRRQTLDLLDVKYAVALHEGNVALFLLAGLGVGLHACDGIGVDDK